MAITKGLGESFNTDGIFREYQLGEYDITEWNNGTKEWRKNGLIHREEGPALEYPGGENYWYLEGEGLSKEEWKKSMLKRKINQILE